MPCWTWSAPDHIKFSNRQLQDYQAFFSELRKSFRAWIRRINAKTPIKEIELIYNI